MGLKKRFLIGSLDSRIVDRRGLVAFHHDPTILDTCVDSCRHLRSGVSPVALLPSCDPKSVDVAFAPHSMKYVKQ